MAVISREQLRRIKKMGARELEAYLIALYQQGVEDGLREAEKEFDDPEQYQIIDADEAMRRIGEEQYRRLVE